jgi:hypothetical protein
MHQETYSALNDMQRAILGGDNNIGIDNSIPVGQIRFRQGASPGVASRVSAPGTNAAHKPRRTAAENRRKTKAQKAARRQSR